MTAYATPFRLREAADMRNAWKCCRLLRDRPGAHGAAGGVVEANVTAIDFGRVDTTTTDSVLVSQALATWRSPERWAQGACAHRQAPFIVRRGGL